MIRTLNTLYDMRDNFKDYIAEASPFMPTRVKNRELEEIVKYADKLFGYIPLDRIYKNIYKVHGVNCVIETSSNKLLIQAGANDIKLFMNPSALNKYLLAISVEDKIRLGRYNRKGMSDSEYNLFTSLGIPDWYISNMKEIKYLFPKGHCVAYIIIEMIHEWFKSHQNTK